MNDRKDMFAALSRECELLWDVARSAQAVMASGRLTEEGVCVHPGEATDLQIALANLERFEEKTPRLYPCRAAL